jgi:hypothetical protein
VHVVCVKRGICGFFWGLMLRAGLGSVGKCKAIGFFSLVGRWVRTPHWCYTRQALSRPYRSALLPAAQPPDQPY